MAATNRIKAALVEATASVKDLLRRQHDNGQTLRKALKHLGYGCD